MSVRNFICLALGIFLISCSSNSRSKVEVEKPRNLLSKEKMVMVMSDVVVLESHIQRELQRPEQYAIPMTNSIDSLLKKHQVSMVDYEISFDYYGVQEEEIKMIYQAVFDTVTNRMNRLKATSLNVKPIPLSNKKDE